MPVRLVLIYIKKVFWFKWHILKIWSVLLLWYLYLRSFCRGVCIYQLFTTGQRNSTRSVIVKSCHWHWNSVIP